MNFFFGLELISSFFDLLSQSFISSRTSDQLQQSFYFYHRF
jgi:hypothetical protein